MYPRARLRLLEEHLVSPELAGPQSMRNGDCGHRLRACAGLYGTTNWYSTRISTEATGNNKKGSFIRLCQVQVSVLLGSLLAMSRGHHQPFDNRFSRGAAPSNLCTYSKTTSCLAIEARVRILGAKVAQARRVLLQLPLTTLSNSLSPWCLS